MGILFVLFCFMSVVSSQPPPEDEECALNFDSPVYVCPDELSKELLDTSDIEVQRHNETTSYMSGKFKLLKTFEACVVIEIIVEKTHGGRTEIMATHDICNLCDEIREDSNYRKYLKYFELPTSCPLEPGEYDVVNFVTDTEDMPVNKANEARYQVTLNFHGNEECDCKQKVFLGCLKIDFVIEPV